MMADTTVGVPVYNGEATLKSALDSLLKQDYYDIEIIICDNASTDSTKQICSEYMKKDPRIRVIRHDINVGAIANFEFALSQAKTPFFMWAAADDVRSFDFIRLNRQFLIDNPNYVASVSPVRFSDGHFDPQRMGDGLLNAATIGERVHNYLGNLHANGAYYSLYRREPLVKSLVKGQTFVGHDWSTIIRLASLGPMQRITDGYIELGHLGASSSRQRFGLFRRRRRSWVLPLFEVSQDALAVTRSSPRWKRLLILCALARLNFVAAAYQIVLESDLLYKTARAIRGR
jgi:glycosyltransferase involved in cell wall biosynthesis